jgi:hypothetical protein
MKKCSTCKEEKPLRAFHSSPRASCKECINKRSTAWRNNNLEKARGYFTIERAKISEWKAIRGCSACEENDPVCLDMHHLDPTTKEGDPSRRGRFENFLKEAEKCVVLCRNCHAKVHAGKIKLTNDCEI